MKECQLGRQQTQKQQWKPDDSELIDSQYYKKETVKYKCIPRKITFQNNGKIRAF